MSKAKPENNSSKEEQPLVESSLSDIRKSFSQAKKGSLIKLPICGLVFRVGRPTLSKLLKEDKVPSELIGAAIKLDTEAAVAKNKKEYLESHAVLDLVVCEASIHPKIVANEEETGDNAIHIDELDDQDKFAIYLFVQSGVEPLSKFRDDQVSEDAGSDLSEISQ